MRLVKIILTTAACGLVCQETLDMATGASMIPGLQRGARKLLCSFCGKRDSEVAKLIAGPKVHICDACIGVCNKILQAMPERFSGWDAMSDEQLLDALRPTSASVDAMRNVLQAQIDTLRERGVSWATIGAALGMSRQAAWERFS